MKITQIALFLSIVVLASCTQNQKPSEADKAEVIIPQAEIQIKDQKVEQVFDNYLKVKDALVLSDPEKVKKASADLANALKNVEGCENAAKIANNIAASDVLVEQRKQFTLLNSDIIPLIKGTEITRGTVFLQYCPMANDGDGGYWLASVSEIRNPYYGDEMLNCGEVKEEFKSPKK